MIRSVYVVEHSHVLDDCESGALIGVFLTEKIAKEIVEKYKKLPGFKDFPDNFFINEYVINKCEWEEGFIIEKPNRK